jgi:hypothetical protein
LGYLLAGGLLVSIVLCVVFYLLLVLIHPPAALRSGSAGLTIKDWLAAYANWSNNRVFYTKAYGLCLFASMGFAIAFGTFIAPRLAFFASLFSLNVYFAWTSHLLGDISGPIDHQLTLFIFGQAKFLWVTGSLAYFVPNYIVVADSEVLGLLMMVIVTTFVLNRGKGVKMAVLRSFQVGAISVAVLGAEIMLLDYNEFYLHVTQTQVVLDFMPWFTNADLLFCGLAIFAVTTCLLNFRSIWHQRY